MLVLLENNKYTLITVGLKTLPYKHRKSNEFALWSFLKKEPTIPQIVKKGLHSKELTIQVQLSWMKLFGAITSYFKHIFEPTHPHYKQN